MKENQMASPHSVITRSFGAAVYLHALGHPCEDVRSRDGSVFNAYWYFPPAARRDIERYYASRDRLNAFASDHLDAEDTHTEKETA
jgi:hypothetical protein